MDLKVYYQKIREVERSIPEEDPVVMSHETADGGKAGVQTEVPRYRAAKMIVEGTARLATAEEAKDFREQKAEAKRVADQRSAASRLQVTVVSESDLRAIRSASKTDK